MQSRLCSVYICSMLNQKQMHFTGSAFELLLIPNGSNLSIWMEEKEAMNCPTSSESKSQELRKWLRSNYCDQLFFGCGALPPIDDLSNARSTEFCSAIRCISTMELNNFRFLLFMISKNNQSKLIIVACIYSESSSAEGDEPNRWY